ncbi:MAG: hypothetical protein K2G77_08925 [Muribaculaceae bacterium]|nr:hypothetical protein [Muribaculaceae bacterium]
MSGASGSYSLPIENFSCEKLVITTVLTNPVMAIIQNLHIGDILDIEIVPNTGVIAKANSQTAGIVQVGSYTMDKLIDCIDGGTVYIGTVMDLDITNGVCRIKISVP